MIRIYRVLEFVLVSVLDYGTRQVGEKNVWENGLMDGLENAYLNLDAVVHIYLGLSESIVEDWIERIEDSDEFC